MDSYHRSPRLIAHPTSPASSPLMCEDLCVEIFKRLPIKSLLQFRCVCKLWKSLISSSIFINLHHSFTSSTTPSNLKPYLIGRFKYSHGASYALYRPEETLAEHLRRDLHFPFRIRYDEGFSNYLYCVDVIHGLVCVSYTSDSSLDSTVLWNPAIHKYVALPRLPLAPQLQKLMADYPHVKMRALFLSNAIGFGYDTSTSDFKVVRIWNPCYTIKQYCKSHPPTFQVYSTLEGLWRVPALADFDINACPSYNIEAGRCFVNGTIHWLVKSYACASYNNHLLMFDCEHEEFRTTELPKEIFQGTTGYGERILEYAGMVSVMVRTSTLIGDVQFAFETWVMEEHGVATSWKKLYRIRNHCHKLKVYDIDQYQPLFGKLPPYGPNQWTKNPAIHIDDVLGYHVYEESIYLMNDTKAQSYAQEEIVHI